MYRQRIQDQHIRLSPSYRRVADFVLSRYYDVAFMTAAQLAAAVEVDTTTVVRFSQRLGYPGYPEFLEDVRDQVREELYAVYEPAPRDSTDPAAIFKSHIDQESANLRQITVHNPPARLLTIVRGLAEARRILLVAEGDIAPVIQAVGSHLRQQGLSVEAVSGDPMQQAALLAGFAPGDVVLGVCDGDERVAVARALAFARARNCTVYAVSGTLEGPLARQADEILYVPSLSGGGITSIVALIGGLLALAQALAAATGGGKFTPSDAVQAAYAQLIDTPTDGGLR